MTGRLEAIHISRGGVPKLPVFEALITERGVEGDSQDDLRHHGGADRAVVIFSLDVIRALQQEGHGIQAGTTGENLTVSGLEWAALAPGDELQIRDVRLRLTKFADPCRNIAGSFAGGRFIRIDQDRHPGWSRLCARVVSGGLVRPGDTVKVVPRAE